MKLKLRYIFIIFIVFLYAHPVFAQTPAFPTPVDYKLPYPGILPDHPLYRFKKIRDFIIYSLNRSPQKRIELNLLFADKKIVMAQTLLEKRETDLAVDTLLDSQMDLFKAASLLPVLSEKNILPVGLSDKISLSSQKHSEIINMIYTSVSDLSQKEKVTEAQKLNNQAKSQIKTVK